MVIYDSDQRSANDTGESCLAGWLTRFINTSFRYKHWRRPSSAFLASCFHDASWTQAIVGDLSRAEGALRTHLVHLAMSCPADVRQINGKAQKTRVKLREKGKLSLFIKRIVGVWGNYVNKLRGQDRFKGTNGIWNQGLIRTIAVISSD